LIDQISNGTPGGGNMPAYGEQMKPAEMSVIVDFLTNLATEWTSTGHVTRPNLAGSQKS